jgi:Asp-tRNA(Asn)/Glu-tRNA(Gln) amidotransferase A subunit family amidase
MSAGLADESAARLAARIRLRQVSPVEVVAAHVRRIEDLNPRLHAFVALALERALAEARAAERAVMRRAPLGRRGKPPDPDWPPLLGVPISIKDVLDVAGLPAVAGTRLRAGHVPATDAPVVVRLRRAGAILLGKTNVPECALDWRTDNPLFGETVNPWDPERTPGGSSGGEAAAIAARCSAAGVGSDLGGSIRVPAHFCGIAGLKPTPGRVPASGHFPPVAGPLTHGLAIGPLARRVEDLALMLEVMTGFDPADPGSVPVRRRRAAAGRGAGPPGGRPGAGARFERLRAAFYVADGVAPVTPATREAVEGAARALQERGLEVAEGRPPGIGEACDLWTAWIGRGGVGPVVALYEGREALMGPLIRALRARLQSRPMSVDDFLRAWYGRDRLRAAVLEWMKRFPVLLAPVAALPAFRRDHRGPFQVEGWTVEYQRAFSYSQAFNLLGFPAAVVPIGRSPEGLPIGVQVVGRPFRDGTVLRVAALLEEAAGPWRAPQDPAGEAAPGGG